MTNDGFGVTTNLKQHSLNIHNPTRKIFTCGNLVRKTIYNIICLDKIVHSLINTQGCITALFTQKC